MDVLANIAGVVAYFFTRSMGFFLTSLSPHASGRNDVVLSTHDVTVTLRNDVVLSTHDVTVTLRRQDHDVTSS
jgi:hypothetical protein